MKPDKAEKHDRAHDSVFHPELRAGQLSDTESSVIHVLDHKIEMKNT